MNSNDRIAATLYSLGTVFLMNISVYTLRKGDDDNDDNNNNNTQKRDLIQVRNFKYSA